MHITNTAVLQMGRIEQFVFKGDKGLFIATIAHYAEYSDLLSVVFEHLELPKGSSDWLRVHSALADRNILRGK